MSITKEIQKTQVDTGLVHLYEIELSDSSFIYFTPYTNSNDSSIQMYDYTTNTQLNTYNPLPIMASGFEQRQTGPIARPEITISLAVDVSTASTSTSFRLATTRDYQDVLGMKLIRRTTLAKYVVGGSQETSSGETPIEFARQVWIFDRIREFNKTSITYELASPFDLTGLNLPKREVVGNACSWLYQGASPDYTEAEKKGGCTWHRESKISVVNNDASTEYVVFVNKDDEYVVPDTTTFVAYNSNNSITANDYISTSGTADRFNENGSVDEDQSITNYWQAKSTGASLGTPTDANTNFNRVRVYSTNYAANANYFAFVDDQHNSYVSHNAEVSAGVYKEQLWKTKKTTVGVAPDYNQQWERGDVCGKRLTSCNMRFNFDPITANNSNTTAKAAHSNTNSLPFGGFPGSQRYS